MSIRVETKPVIGYKEYHTCDHCGVRCERLIKGKKRGTPIEDHILTESWIAPPDHNDDKNAKTG